MPNWCDNKMHLDFRNKDEAIRFLNKLQLNPTGSVETFSDIEGFHEKLIGIEPEEPKWFADKSRRDWWYKWREFHWGCKWDIDSMTIEYNGDCAVYSSYWTPWTPNITAIDRVFVDYDCKAQLMYWEAGMCFAGIYFNGEDFYANEVPYNQGMAILHKRDIADVYPGRTHWQRIRVEPSTPSSFLEFLDVEAKQDEAMREAIEAMLGKGSEASP